MFLEVIAYSKQDVEILNNSNADRIELLANPVDDGTTPDKADLLEIIKITKKPIRVMIRNNDNTFIYSDSVFAEFLDQIEIAKKAGYEGIVFGCLNKNGEIDIEQMKQVMKAAGKLKVTFSRAFDLIKEDKKIAEMNKLIKLGVSTILTSGADAEFANAAATDNLHTIKELVTASAGKIQILAGCGINYRNVSKIMSMGIKNIHVGTGARENGTYDGNISTVLIDKIKAQG